MKIMTKLSVLALVALSIVLPSSSFAATNQELLESLQGVRGKLVALIGTSEKGPQQALVEDIKKATQDIDSKFDAMIGAAQGDAKTKLTECKTVWGEFKTTRDSEIIPAVLAGDAAKAKSIAQGVQVERFKKMASLLQ
jgi:hypothetical protein